MVRVRKLKHFVKVDGYAIAVTERLFAFWTTISLVTLHFCSLTFTYMRPSKGM